MTTSTLTGVRGLLVDMDGTLVDSHAAVERSWRRWPASRGVDAEALVAVCHGATGGETMRRFRPDLDDATIERDNAELLAGEAEDVRGVVAAVGAEQFVATVERLGLPWAVVTNADTRLARARLGAAGVTPPELVSVDDVAVGKPDPASYLVGAQRLGVSIADCLVVEDSESGLLAARAAGARVAMLRRGGGDVEASDLAALASMLADAHAS